MENTLGESFSYFDSPEVRDLLHVSKEALPTYQFVNSDVTNAYRPQLEASSWVYDLLLGKYSQYKVLQIHANSDGLLTIPGLWKDIEYRDYLTAESEWLPLLTDGTDLFGYTKNYGRYKLVTVHGEGHSGALMKYKHVYTILNNFMSDLPLDYNFS